MGTFLGALLRVPGDSNGHLGVGVCVMEQVLGRLSKGDDRKLRSRRVAEQRAPLKLLLPLRYGWPFPDKTKGPASLVYKGSRAFLTGGDGGI
jgi:hypothetical protein